MKQPPKRRWFGSQRGLESVSSWSRSDSGKWLERKGSSSRFDRELARAGARQRIPRTAKADVGACRRTRPPRAPRRSGQERGLGRPRPSPDCSQEIAGLVWSRQAVVLGVRRRGPFRHVAAEVVDPLRCYVLRRLADRGRFRGRFAIAVHPNHSVVSENDRSTVCWPRAPGIRAVFAPPRCRLPLVLRRQALTSCAAVKISSVPRHVIGRETLPTGLRLEFPLRRVLHSGGAIQVGNDLTIMPQSGIEADVAWIVIILIFCDKDRRDVHVEHLRHLLVGDFVYV